MDGFMKKYISALLLCCMVFALMSAPTSAVSPSAQQEVEDFLNDFWSIFSLGRYDYDGVFINWHGWGAIDYTPLVYCIHEKTGTAFYDRWGNEISEDALFYKDGSIAFDFTLYDLDNDGIPEILMRYVYSTWGFNILYKFIDGQYHEVGGFAGAASFYRGPNGRLVTTEFDHLDMKVSYLGWDIDSIQKETVLDWNMHRDIRGADGSFDNPVVPGIGQLTPIDPLTDLEEAIRQSITQRLTQDIYDDVTPGEIILYLDGENSPILEDNRMFVPFRAIFEALGADIIWDDNTKTATGILNETTIQLTIGSETAYINGQPINLYAAPRTKDDRTFVPLWFLAENFGLRLHGTKIIKRLL